MYFKKNLKIFLIASIFLFAGSSVFGANFSLKFDGIDDYIDCGNNASLDFGAGNFTIETWFKTSATPVNYYPLISKMNNDWSIGWEIYLSSVDDAIAFYAESGEISIYPVHGLATPYDEAWHQIVVVRNGDVFTVYFDADDGFSGETSAVPSLTITEDLYIGRNYAPGYDGGYEYYFDGLIDEVRIYNRALSPTEIDEHYNGIFENETGLKLHLPMDEGAGSIAYDSSGLGNHGTIYGATYQSPPIIEISAGFATTTLAYAGDLFTDLSVPIILTIGLPLGFWVIKKIITLVRVR